MNLVIEAENSETSKSNWEMYGIAGSIFQFDTLNVLHKTAQSKA